MAYEAKLLIENEQRSLLTFHIHYFEGRNSTIMDWYDNNSHYYLRTLDSLREAIKSDLHAFRFVGGQPYGGLLELTMESTGDNDDFFYDWFIPSERSGTAMKNGVIEFYNDGEEAVPFKRIEFWDAWIANISENMCSTGNDPMTINLRISPATIRYNKSHIVRKTWYETDITETTAYMPKIAEANYPTTTPTSSSATVAKSSNKFGKIAEGALGTIVTAAAAALSKKSTQETLKAKLESVVSGVTNEDKTPRIVNIQWVDKNQKPIDETYAIDGEAYLKIATKNYNKGDSINIEISCEGSSNSDIRKIIVSEKVDDKGVIFFKPEYSEDILVNKEQTLEV